MPLTSSSYFLFGLCYLRKFINLNQCQDLRSNFAGEGVTNFQLNFEGDIKKGGELHFPLFSGGIDGGN